MTPPLLFASAALLCGFSLKAALAPFHAWLPDAHPTAPAPVSAMLSGVLIKAVGIYVVARLFFNVLGVTGTDLAVLRWLGAISMVVGGLLAVGQWDMKRLFAYSSVSQVGYMVLGLGVGTPLAVAGALYHLVNHCVFKSLLFLNAGAVEYATGTRDLRRLGGLNRSMPVTSVTSLVASMSISGIPPFNGFWSKLIIVLACVEAGYHGFAAVAVIMSVVTLAYQLKVQRHAFFSATSPGHVAARAEPPLMAAAMIVLAIGCGALSLLVVSGLGRPLLVAPAEQTLLAGTLTFQKGMQKDETAESSPKRSWIPHPALSQQAGRGKIDDAKRAASESRSSTPAAYLRQSTTRRGERPARPMQSQAEART